MLDFSQIFPEHFSDNEWEVESKGCFFGAQIVVSGRSYKLNFYDPVRLRQEIESEFSEGKVFFEKNLIVIKLVTRLEMEKAAESLVRSGRVDLLAP